MSNADSMRIDHLLRTDWPAFSFEFMAPRSDTEVDVLFQAAEQLRELEPAFVCVTCRAPRHRQTLNIVYRIQQNTAIPAMAHLVCKGCTIDDVDNLLEEMKQKRIANVLALRGDGDDAEFKGSELKYATELISIAARQPGLCVGAACYPEGHVESPDRASDLLYTKRKVELGASFFITQFFFDNRHYFGFVKQARAAGIDVPILPGIMPITSAKQIPRISTMGASVPDALSREILARADDPQAVAQFGVAWATLQCTNLLAAGVPGIHFYTFNRSAATRAILGALRAAQPWKWSNRDAIA